MEDLNRFYRRALRARVAALEEALVLLSTEREPALASIRGIAHALRGSGATYGFPEVSVAAAGVEAAGEGDLEASARALLALLRGLAAPGDTKRVLVVDDDPEMQLLLRTILQTGDVEVQAAGSAAEARAQLATNHFDLIILDLLLPDADGRELIADVRRVPERARVRVFVLSAKRAAAAEEIVGLGATRFIEKPFDPETLAAELRAELDAAR